MRLISYKYFPEHQVEFESPDAPGSGVNMSQELLQMLSEAREIAGIPFVISSGYRTEERNELVGGVIGSAHTKGLACDIVAEAQEKKLRITVALTLAGFKRIGWYDSFIHADIDESKPTPAYWVVAL